MLKSHTYHRFAVVLVGALVSGVGAQAQTVASTSGTVTGLTYHLIDLDTSDGITPWVKFSDIPGSTNSYTEFLNRTMYAKTSEPDLGSNLPGILFGPSSGSTSNAAGNQVASKSGNSVATSITTSLSDLNNPATLAITPAGGLMYSAQVGVYGNSGTYFNRSFVLSPHTQLVIDGTVDLRATADASLLDGTALAQLLTTPEKGLTLSSSSSASLSFFLGAPLYYENYSQTAYATSTLGKAPNYWYNGVPGAVLEDFHFPLSNTSDSDLTGSFHYAFHSDVSLLLTLPSVPEPATWALMGLGSAGIGMVRRRASRLN